MHTFESKLYDIDNCTKSDKNLRAHQSTTLDFIKIAYSNEPITIQCAIEEMLINVCACENFLMHPILY